MKRTKVGIILCILLLGCILPVVGGQVESTTNEDVNGSNSDFLAAGPVYKIFFIGRIKDLVIDDELPIGNYSHFTIVRAWAITVYRFGVTSRSISVTHTRNMPQYFQTGYWEFQGILRNRFVCGVFKYNYVV